MRLIKQVKIRPVIGADHFIFNFYESDSELSNRDLLRQYCEIGLRERYRDETGENGNATQANFVMDRLQMELDQIEELELIDCFLILRDLSRFARGHRMLLDCYHVVSSIVGYVLYLTDICPIHHGLPIEQVLQLISSRTDRDMTLRVTAGKSALLGNHLHSKFPGPPKSEAGKWRMKDHSGLLKLRILDATDRSNFCKILETIEMQNKVVVDFENIPLDDSKTLTWINDPSKWPNGGLHFLSEPEVIRLIPDFRIERFEDLVKFYELVAKPRLDLKKSTEDKRLAIYHAMRAYKRAYLQANYPEDFQRAQNFLAPEWIGVTTNGDRDSLRVHRDPNQI